MSRCRELYELQEVDLAIDEKEEALAYLESQLGKNEALLEARADLEKEQQRLAELDKKQRGAEWEVDDLQAKISPLEDKLYSGSVKNIKELSGLQQEVEHLKAQRRQKEDQILDIMAEVEAAQGSLKRRSAEVEQMERRWQEEQEQLYKEREQAKEELAVLKDRRHSLILQIDSASLNLYEALRVEKQGRGVAKVERGMCQGCHITLSMAELQQARAGQELVQCSSCGRILYVM